MKLKYLFLLLFIATYNVAPAQYVVRVAGIDSVGSIGDGGPAINTYMFSPYGICQAKNGDLYFADNLWGLECCGFGRIRKINAATGIISTIAGSDTSIILRNNVPATGSLVFSFGLHIDDTGNLYLAEGSSFVRMINHATGIISIIAGQTDTGYSGDGGQATAAKMSEVQDLVFDTQHNMYIADAAHSVIRKVNAAGIITTIAGNGTAAFSGDGGPATAASLNSPSGLCVGKEDSCLYIADYYNSRIRMVNTLTGIITTVVGNGSYTDTGDDGPATAAGILGPRQIAADKEGNLYIIGSKSERIRKVDAVTHIISTYAGSGDSYPGNLDSLGDGGPATNAIISPSGMCFDSCGDLIFTDFFGSVRAVVNEMPTGGTLCNVFITNSVADVAPGSEVSHLFPNPATNQVCIADSRVAQGQHTTVKIINMTGQTVICESPQWAGQKATISLVGLMPGSYCVVVQDSGGNVLCREMMVKM